MLLLFLAVGGPFTGDFCFQQALIQFEAQPRIGRVPDFISVLKLRLVEPSMQPSLPDGRLLDPSIARFDNVLLFLW